MPASIGANSHKFIIFELLCLQIESTGKTEIIIAAFGLEHEIKIPDANWAIIFVLIYLFLSVVSVNEIYIFYVYRVVF